MSGLTGSGDRGLAHELEELERVDPDVRQAAERLDSVTADILRGRPDADPSVTDWHEATEVQEMSTSEHLRMQLTDAMHDTEHIAQERDFAKLQLDRTRAKNERLRDTIADLKALYESAVGNAGVIERLDAAFCVDCSHPFPSDAVHSHELIPVLVTVTRRRA